jgi:hypothetical protein
MQTQWLCLGGPIHGEWRPVGSELLVADPSAQPSITRDPRWSWRPTVVIHAAPILYRPTLMCLPGWRVKLPVWCEDRLARGKVHALPFASVLPGGLHAVPRNAQLVCRWCYGIPVQGKITCHRTACITTWAAVQSLDTMTWRGED